MSQSKTLNLPIRKNEKFSSVSQFTLGPKIGDGGFARVNKAIDDQSGTEYALKIMHIPSMSEGDIQNIEKELDIHSSLDSPFVIKLVDFFQEKENLYMILEMAEHGNLYSYMYKNYKLSPDQIRHFWVQTLQGIGYLHSVGVYMRDLKPENILIDKQKNAKLCDFGWASRMSDEEYRSLAGGTFIYMSPENLRGELQGLASDMWSMGVLLYELVHYSEPFKLGISAEEQLEYIQQGRKEFGYGVPEIVQNLVTSLLSEKEEDRPSAQQVLENYWVQEYFEIKNAEKRRNIHFT